MQLRYVYTPDVVRCTGDTDALTAAGMMRHRHVGALVIVDSENTPIGVVTDRDLVVQVLAEGLDPRKTSIGPLARKPVVIAEEEEELKAAVERMRTHGIRRLPIVNRSGALVGITTLDDVLGYIVEEANALVQMTTKEQNVERHLHR